MDVNLSHRRVVTGGAVGDITPAALLLVLLTAMPQSQALEPPQGADAWRHFDPAAWAEHLDELLTPAALSPGYWHTKPRLPTLYSYPERPTATDSDCNVVRRMKAGEFGTDDFLEWLPLGVPPPWKENPFNNNSWDLWRHALTWTRPLVNVWLTDQDPSSLALLKRIWSDWIEHNSLPPGESEYAWGDHTVAIRLRVLCWFWELWRTSDAYDPAFGRLLLASAFQHALCICDPEMYPEHSNHGLEMTGSLLAAAITFPEFKRAPDWEQLARGRVSRYIAQNFSPEGFHLEQSPAYHWFVLGRLSETLRFLRGNGRELAPNDLVRLRRALAVWPYLRKPDGRLPTVGDSEALMRPGSPLDVELLGGAAAVQDSLWTCPNPRDDGTQFLLSRSAGYAIFYPYTPNEPATRTHPSDTYALFKCNSFDSTHSRHDALSFVLFGLGRDWLIDSGALNYEEKTPQRQYMRSARAHSVVLVDDQDFGFNPLRLSTWGRTEQGDFVTVRHEMKTATHTRTFRFTPPRTVELTDELTAADGQPHCYAQLFHAAPDVQVTIAPDGVAVLTADNGDRCEIHQQGDEGTWSVIKGQTEPVYQGWYSPMYGELVESPVLYYTSATSALHWTCHTRVELRSAVAETQPSAQD